MSARMKFDAIDSFSPFKSLSSCSYNTFVCVSRPLDGGWASLFPHYPPPRHYLGGQYSFIFLNNLLHRSKNIHSFSMEQTYQVIVFSLISKYHSAL